MTHRELCLKCLRAKKCCYCAMLQPFDCQTRQIILMHPLEFKKRCKTGRMCHLIAKNSELIVGINFDDNLEFKRVLDDSDRQLLLVYPGKDSQSLSSAFAPQPSLPTSSLSREPQPKYTLIYIDATWPCARKMMKTSTVLHALQRVSIQPEQTSNFRTYLQPAKECLSTIEAMTHLLEFMRTHQIDNSIPGDVKSRLLTPFDWMVDYNLDAAVDPSRQHFQRGGKMNGPKPLKVPSRRWESRSLFFK
jgi:DTW domain-containing protein YfiP